MSEKPEKEIWRPGPLRSRPRGPWPDRRLAVSAGKDQPCQPFGPSLLTPILQPKWASPAAFQPDRSSPTCATPSASLNDKPGADGLSDVDRFARFMRSTGKPPPRGRTIAQTTSARTRPNYNKVGCLILSRQQTLTTCFLPEQNQRRRFSLFRPALAEKQFHSLRRLPSFHNVGTGRWASWWPCWRHLLASGCTKTTWKTFFNLRIQQYEQ